MGATVTTFCNESNVIVYTSLSVLVPYYWTNNLMPGNCVSYTVGRVWFSAYVELQYTAWFVNFPNIYLPISTTQAAGDLDPVLTYMKYINLTAEQSNSLIKSPEDIVENDFWSVWYKRTESLNHLQDFMHGVYTGWNRKITITGGPAIMYYMKNPLFPCTPPHYCEEYLILLPAQFEPLKMKLE